MLRGLFACLALLALGYFLYGSPAPVASKKVATLERTPPAVSVKVEIPLKPQVVARAPAEVKDHGKSSLPATIKLDRSEVSHHRERPLLEQKSHRWRWLSGAVAVSSGDERVAQIPRLSERAGFWIIAEGDLPAGVVGFPLLEREDNGLLGIFTGTMKAMGKGQLRSPDQFQTQCPCEIQESYAQLKSYLLKPKDDNYSEFKDCLASTGLFKKLEWEILDRPRTIR